MISTLVYQKGALYIEMDCYMENGYVLIFSIMIDSLTYTGFIGSKFGIGHLLRLFRLTSPFTSDPGPESILCIILVLYLKFMDPSSNGK